MYIDTHITVPLHLSTFNIPPKTEKNTRPLIPSVLVILIIASQHHDVPQDGAPFWPWCYSGDGDCFGATSSGLTGGLRSSQLHMHSQERYTYYAALVNGTVTGLWLNPYTKEASTEATLGTTTLLVVFCVQNLCMSVCVYPVLTGVMEL